MCVPFNSGWFLLYNYKNSSQTQRIMLKYACMCVCVYLLQICCVVIHVDLVCYHCTGNTNIIEGPNNITYIPGLTQLPIELTCNVTGVASWKVNGSGYFLHDLTNGVLPGHSRTGTNILVNSPVNNTEYICVSQTMDGGTESDPAYCIIYSEYGKYILSQCVCLIEKHQV